MFVEISNQLAKDVNWPLVFYIVLAALLYIIVNRTTDLSLTEFVRMVLREIREIVTQKATAGTVNMAGVLSCLVFTLAYLSSTTFREVIEAATTLGRGNAPDASNAVLYFGGLLIFALTIASVLAVRPRKRD